MDVRYLADQVRYQTMTTDELRNSFMVDSLFKPGEVVLLYTDVDRAIVGSVVPYELENKDGLYIGRGSKQIEFESIDSKNPAKYYLLSYPAHTKYPTSLVKKTNANPVHLGSQEESNKRTIYQYIHENGVKSCQLVMGFTQLDSGSIWNTMSAHTHQRRTEIYIYFDMGKDDLVFHFMGKPEATKHLIIRNEQAVLSPSWSLHSGAGTRNYAFIWGMGGENQEFTDMDGISMDDLK